MLNSGPLSTPGQNDEMVSLIRETDLHGGGSDGDVTYPRRSLQRPMSRPDPSGCPEEGSNAVVQGSVGSGEECR